jgi:putative ATP-dependent endonuclease of OLD family
LFLGTRASLPLMGFPQFWNNNDSNFIIARLLHKPQEPLAAIIAGDGDFEGELARFGHGLQRSYLLALLHELAATDDTNAPRLILGCEEPELDQHPPQARHFASVLQKLSKNNAQIIVSTHSPLFVTGETFEDVRMVRKGPVSKTSTVTFITYEEIA